MENLKFDKKSESYHQSVQEILKLGYSETDYIHHNGAFNGYVNIARHLALYEAYKMTLGLCGHIAEVGVWKGASLLYFAKLVDIFEPHSYTLVHGFDWFEGMDPDENESAHIAKDSYNSDYDKLRKLIEIQDLDRTIRIHKLDVTKELDSFFQENFSLQFKLVFLDAGVYRVIQASLPHFWTRLSPGGVLLLDHFNHQKAPGETQAVREFLPQATVHTFPFSRQPSGYIIKL